MKPGAMLVTLDPAAAHSGELLLRPDLAFFVTHPCHPPVVNDETDPEARLDFFGAIKAKQHVVAALMQGDEADYANGEALVRTIFAPVMNVYRVTVEQMAILEPALSETVVLTCMVIITEAIEEAVRRGVPARGRPPVRARAHERRYRHPVQLHRRPALRRRQDGGGPRPRYALPARLAGYFPARERAARGQGDRAWDQGPVEA